ncbi:HD domain-containing protein [bacterium]|nr:HD domain-containing protein [bacterium]
MRIVNVERLQPGDTLGKSLFNERGELLLSSGFSLNEDMIRKIARQGYTFVYVMDEFTEDVKPQDVIDDTIRQQANAALAEQFKGCKDNLAFEKLAPEEIKRRLNEEDKVANLIKMPSIRNQVTSILDEIVDNHVSMFTSLPMKADAGADYQHAIDTTVLSILIAQKFRFDYRELKVMGTACMLHDIGKMAFPKLAEKPPKELTRDERMILREHPVYSMKILAGSSPDGFVEQAVVLQHHERYDGQGYPQRMRSSTRPPNAPAPPQSGIMHRYAEILAVANHYDNLLSGHIDGRKYEPAEAIIKVINEGGRMFNPHVVNALTQVVQCYPVGATVKIRKNASGAYEGYVGVIKEANETDQSKPVIILLENTVGSAITPRVVDFSGERHMALELLV